MPSLLWFATVICSHLGDTELAMSAKVCPERLKGEDPPQMWVPSWAVALDKLKGRKKKAS